MRAALRTLVLLAGLALWAPDAPAQKNEGMGLLGTSTSSSSNSGTLRPSSGRVRHTPSTRKRTTGTQDTPESGQQGEPAAEKPSDKK